MSERDRPVGAPGRRRAVRQGLDVGNATADVLGDVVLDRTRNPLTALHVLSYIAVWGLFVEAYGREPKSLRELARTMKRSDRTMTRWASKFGDVFPEYATPAVLWAGVGPQVMSSGNEGLTVDQVMLRLGGAQL